MKEVMTKMYEALDGTLFTSPSAAKQHEANLILAGARPTEAQVTRKVAKLYALHLMKKSGGPFLGKESWHFGKCEIEQLLDLIYGHRRDGRPVDVNAMIGEINFLLET